MIPVPICAIITSAKLLLHIIDILIPSKRSTVEISRGVLKHHNFCADVIHRTISVRFVANCFDDLKCPLYITQALPMKSPVYCNLIFVSKSFSRDTTTHIPNI